MHRERRGVPHLQGDRDSVTLCFYLNGRQPTRARSRGGLGDAARQRHDISGVICARGGGRHKVRSVRSCADCVRADGLADGVAREWRSILQRRRAARKVGKKTRHSCGLDNQSARGIAVVARIKHHCILLLSDEGVAEVEHRIDAKRHRIDVATWRRAFCHCKCSTQNRDVQSRHQAVGRVTISGAVHQEPEAACSLHARRVSPDAIHRIRLQAEQRRVVCERHCPRHEPVVDAHQACLHRCGEGVAGKTR